MKKTKHASRDFRFALSGIRVHLEQIHLYCSGYFCDTVICAEDAWDKVDENLQNIISAAQEARKILKDEGLVE